MSEHIHHVTDDTFEPEVLQAAPSLLVPGFDGWIIGDDPASARVLQAGRRGRLRAAVKWGVGIDNVDMKAAEALGVTVVNTPRMFGREVADLAFAYLVALAREFVSIDSGVRAGGWPKPRGISLAGRTLGLAGLGDIGMNLARRARAADMAIIGYDPAVKSTVDGIERALWPERVEECDFLAFACALTPSSRHMLDAQVLAKAKPGVRVVNVARGPLIDESALVDGLASGRVHSAALDVFENEPLPLDSPLRGTGRCLFGSHNGSNTEDAVRRASERAIELLFGLLAKP